MKNFALIVLIVLFLLVFPWRDMEWGRIETMPGRTITVVGEAKDSQVSQMATFNAGVSATKDTKDEAVAEVNQKVTSLLESVKKFGIPEQNIKTQSLNFFQNQDQYVENGRQKSRPGQWVVSNTIDIKLSEASKSGELASMLASNGATTVYGPNFSLTNTKDIESTLIGAAIKNARDKAATIANSSGRKLGKVLSVTEGNTVMGSLPIGMQKNGIGGGTPIEIGTNEVSKQVTVVFELD